MRVLRGLLAATLLTGSAACVRAPEPLDVHTLIARRGPEEARRDLAIRVLDDPRDVGARLALAALADEVGRPAEATEQLEAVERLGGPLGTRWNAADRARLARLLLARGRARLARGAPSALADLQRAASLGAAPGPDELVSARIAVAVALLRHVDARVRDRGRAILAIHARDGAAGAANAAWRGARENASPGDRGAFGAWLWRAGARQAAFAELRAWHDATPSPREPSLQAAYLDAYAWWTPLWLGELPPPPADDLVGPARCQFPGADCTAPPVEPSPLATDSFDAVDGVDNVGDAAARYAATRAVPATAAQQAELVAIARAHRRDPAIAERLARDLVARSVDAAVGHALVGALYDALGDPARARTSWHAAVSAGDGASALAVEGYGDRHVHEVALLRGLAEAIARSGDGSAALIYATKAAAASGDPAVVWNAVGDALLGVGQAVDALTCARTSLDLAGPEELGRALDLAIAASRLLARTAQADALALQRAQLALARANPIDADRQNAIAAHTERPTAETTARLWVASRAHPRDIETRALLVDALDVDDARRPIVMRELLELSGDPDSYTARAAVAALHRARRPR